MTITKWLAGGAMVAVAALPAAAAPASIVLASNGEIVIGTTATNGNVHVGELTSNGDVVIDPSGTNGNIHIGG